MQILSKNLDHVLDELDKLKFPIVMQPGGSKIEDSDALIPCFDMEGVKNIVCFFETMISYSHLSSVAFTEV